MNIQQFSNLVAKMAKVEEKKEAYKQAINRLNEIIEKASANHFVYDDELRDAHLDAYDAMQRCRKAVKKAYKDFRKAVSEDEEIGYLAESYIHRQYDDADFFYYIRWKVLEEYRHIHFADND